MRDAFDALGVAPAWRLEERLVREAQRRMAARWHPDRFTDAATRDDAQRRVARVNAAAAVLLDPLTRGQALLELWAPAPMPPEARARPEFLARMMVLREAIDEGSADPEVHQDLEDLEGQANADAERHFARLATGEAAAWSEAGEALGRLRALRRAREELARE